MPADTQGVWHKPAQVAKIRKSDQCGLRPVAGNSAQHPSARVWGDFRKEPLNVKMFPSDLPDLSSSQPHSSLPPPVFPGLPSQEQCPPPPPCPFCADTHSYTLLCGSPPGPALGTETKVLALCGAPLAQLCVILTDGDPSDPGRRQPLHAQAPTPNPRCDESGEGTAPPADSISGWSSKLKPTFPLGETPLTQPTPGPIWLPTPTWAHELTPLLRGYCSAASLEGHEGGLQNHPLAELHHTLYQEQPRA